MCCSAGLLYVYFITLHYRRHATFKCFFFLYKNSFLIIRGSLKLPSDRHKCKGLLIFFWSKMYRLGSSPLVRIEITARTNSPQSVEPACN